MDLLSRLHGIDCGEGDRSQCRGTCEHMAGEYFSEEWPRCPVAEIERDRHLIAVMQIRRHAKLSPLSDFPEAYTAGAMQTWSELDAAAADRIESEMPRG